MIAVECREVSKAYRNQPILQALNLSIEAGTFSVILGAPACGKSVLMRLLTGLERPGSGEIILRGEPIKDKSPGELNIGYIPQSFALYPHFKVYDNIAYPLKLIRTAKSEINTIVRQTAELLQINHLLTKKPDQLSGGEKQRVAIARGIVKNTEVFILDDPLTGLDFKLREQLFDDLKQMQMTLGATFIYTTSDPLEALMLAQRIAILDGGRIIEAGSLEDTYSHPQHIRTMTLLGFPQASFSSGALEVKDGQSWCRTPLLAFPVELDAENTTPEQVIVGIRPQNIKFSVTQTDGWLSQQAQIVLRENLGGELVIHLQVEDQSLVSVARHDEVHLLADDHVTIYMPPQSLTLYAADTGQRIGQGAKLA
jgi:ABC-type sugar transport system ATPase subunit